MLFSEMNVNAKLNFFKNIRITQKNASHASQKLKSAYNNIIYKYTP